ncbi:cupin domain-containing protein [Halobacillus salinus]|uniref:Cupin domain-containing protein n=1 Tax=Halobacillus salinus TaxID=192814 RepID=A0A4Z0GZD7_9BACI|nr:cupin domain-containing protein [Halobacillus salinus]TGB01858.1 cupin domain-containing protein [Halobacillus salinus]
MYQGPYIHPFYGNVPVHAYSRPQPNWSYPYGGAYAPYSSRQLMLQDYGPNPFVMNINEATKQNDTFRTALWTGDHLQVTLMSIGVGEDIGLEIHPQVDQFLRIEEGQGLVQMGQNKTALTYERKVKDDDAIIIPAGTWHNVTNTGSTPLKLYSIYAPPNHPYGTVHKTKADAEAAEASQQGNGRAYCNGPQCSWVNYTGY